MREFIDIHMHVLQMDPCKCSFTVITQRNNSNSAYESVYFSTKPGLHIVYLSIFPSIIIAPVPFPRRLSGSEAPLEGPVTSDYPLLKLPRASLSSPSDPFLSHSPYLPTVLPKGKDS